MPARGERLINAADNFLNHHSHITLRFIQSVEMGVRSIKSGVPHRQLFTAGTARVPIITDNAEKYGAGSGSGSLAGRNGGARMTKNLRLVFLAACGLSVAGCQQANHTGNGALIGGGLGAATGAVIGNVTGHAGGGALIGAAAGAAAGGLVGNAADAREERDAAVAQAQYAQYCSAQANAAAIAMTINDVTAMAEGGVNDEVIIASLQSRGCRWDGSPQTIIYLRHHFVSDRVIGVMQSCAQAPPPVDPYLAYPPVPVWGPAPPPPAYWYGPPRPYYGRPHRRW